MLNTLKTTCAGLVARTVGAWSGVVALAYHQIREEPNSPFDAGLWSATPEAFDAQIRFLKSDFDIIRPAELRDAARDAKGRHVIITFDDGYRDNYQRAFPILRDHGVAATFFITTGFLDRRSPAWWDEIAWMVRTSSRSMLPPSGWLAEPVIFDEPQRQQAIRTLLKVWKTIRGDQTSAYVDFLADATGSGRLRASVASDLWMTWDMVREMHAAGMCIGGHTVNHPVLANLGADLQRQEIAGCGERLREELRDPMTCFSYPVGGRGSFNSWTRACLREAGVEFAFSYYGGFRRPDEWDPYDIRRMRVEADMSLDRFRIGLTLPHVFA